MTCDVEIVPTTKEPEVRARSRRWVILYPLPSRHSSKQSCIPVVMLLISPNERCSAQKAQNMQKGQSDSSASLPVLSEQTTSDWWWQRPGGVLPAKEIST